MTQPAAQQSDFPPKKYPKCFESSYWAV